MTTWCVGGRGRPLPRPDLAERLVGASPSAVSRLRQLRGEQARGRGDPWRDWPEGDPRPEAEPERAALTGPHSQCPSWGSGLAAQEGWTGGAGPGGGGWGAGQHPLRGGLARSPDREVRPAWPGVASAPAALPLRRSFLPLFLARAVPTPGPVSRCRRPHPSSRRPVAEAPRAAAPRPSLRGSSQS